MVWLDQGHAQDRQGDNVSEWCCGAMDQMPE
jgi:hypothetical protein